MTSNVPPRHVTAPVRQLSLQQPVPPNRLQQHQQHIRRQRSTEDERVYSSSIASTRNRFSSGDLHHGYSSKSDNKPKVRVAWTSGSDSTSGKHKNEAGVEIVARQIPTNKLSRPATGRGSRGLVTRCPLAEKATILYSRQELAERLRLAWKQRQETKSNIDIFLAHNTVEERCDSRLSSVTNPTASPTPRVLLGGKSHEADREAVPDVPKDNDKHRYQTWFSNSAGRKSIVETTKSGGFQIDGVESERCGEGEGMSEQRVALEKRSISINCNDWNAPIIIEIKPDTLAEPKPLDSSTSSNNEVKPDDGEIKIVESVTVPKEPSQASLKRASFQSKLNKAFNGPIIEKSSLPRVNSRTNLLSPLEPTQRLRRTGSAPSQRSPSPLTYDNLNQETPAEIERRVTSAKEQKSPSVRHVKSAALTKKRSKSGKRRQASLEELSTGTSSGKATKGCKNQTMTESKGSELVTMVSLVSSADSESEIDENYPKDDKLIRELRNKLPTTPIIKTSGGLNSGIRKPFKSVSFQQDYSFDYESPRGEQLQARLKALSKTELSNLGTSAQSNEMTATEIRRGSLSGVGRSELVGPSEREKRCLAVPIDDDTHDRKPKLLRCRSATVTPSVVVSDANKQSSGIAAQKRLQTEMAISQIVSQTSAALRQKNELKVTIDPPMSTTDSKTENDQDISTEPNCQTPKEKECWHLYRKMCDKGVFVSFDTVLRGMLTPTEYRLRQKGLNQFC